MLSSALIGLQSRAEGVCSAHMRAEVAHQAPFPEHGGQGDAAFPGLQC